MKSETVENRGTNWIREGGLTTFTRVHEYRSAVSRVALAKGGKSGRNSREVGVKLDVEVIKLENFRVRCRIYIA